MARIHLRKTIMSPVGGSEKAGVIDLAGHLDAIAATVTATVSAARLGRRRTRTDATIASASIGPLAAPSMAPGRSASHGDPDATPWARRQTLPTPVAA